MPTYDYRCRECGRDFEVFQRMSDRPGASCPACGAAAERLISGGAGLLFKGDGFYITDHRSKEYREKARAEAGGGTDRKGDGKSESKDGSGSSDGGSKSAGAEKKAGAGDKAASGSRSRSTSDSAGGKDH